MNYRVLFAICASLSAVVLGRATCLSKEWEDASGRFKFEAEYVTSDEARVVLEKPDASLVVVLRSELSEADQKFVKAKELLLRSRKAAKKGDPSDPSDSPPKSESVPAAVPGAAASTAITPEEEIAEQILEWTLQNGDVIRGRLIGFGRQDLNVRRDKGEILINDVNIHKLPAEYSLVLPHVVSAIDHVDARTMKKLGEHFAKARTGGEPFTYTVEGINLNLLAGGTIIIPLALLYAEDAKLVAPGFDRWRVAQAAEVSEENRVATAARERLILDSYYRLRGQQAQARQMQWMELQLLSMNAGITSMWEVGLFPNNAYDYPRTVVVTARTSAEASQQALASFPGWSLGPIRALNR